MRLPVTVLVLLVCAVTPSSVRAQAGPAPTPPAQADSSLQRVPSRFEQMRAPGKPESARLPDLQHSDTPGELSIAGPDTSILRQPGDIDWALIPGPVLPDRSRRRVFKWMYQDLGGLARHVVTPKFGLYAAGAMGFTFGLAWLDDEALDVMHDVNRGLVKEFFLVVDTLGGPIINVPVVAAAGISLLTNNQRFQDAAWTSLQTLVYAGVLGYVLKGIFGRDRPIWTEDTYAFFARTGMNPVVAEGNSSFPSGHAISSFGIITPWVLYYPSPFTYALYIIPAGTTLSRLSHSRHWATDVVVGTVIGITMGRWLTARHKRQRTGAEPPRLDLSLARTGVGLSLTYRLD